MDGERIARALSRIEAAADRIERGAKRAPAATAPTGDVELERKYLSLRNETGAALAELDRLIGSLER